MGEKVTLKILEGSMNGQRFEFGEHDTFIFGRSPRDCHACLADDSAVSRHHFILEVNPPAVRLRDLGSRNGTYVNGEKYGGRDSGESKKQAALRRYPQVDLRDGYTIVVGNTVMQVEIKKPRAAKSDNQSPVTTLHRTPKVVEHTPVCGKCGRAMSAEGSLDSSSNYICEPCQDASNSDAGQLVQELLKMAASEQDSQRLPTITGYTLSRQLGKGGMGVVYLAQRKRDKKRVAVKLMLSKVAVDPTARDTFLREVRVLRELRHPNIVRFIDVGAAESMFYFVMDFCEGGSLSKVVSEQRNSLTVPKLGKLMLHALKGLAYAHERKFVHRDLKPDNILVRKTEGRWFAQISDFGLAKDFQKAGFSGMTATGRFGGTYHFMPREQLTNFKYVQPASDIWSIGATFYYLLTGESPRDFADDRDPIEVVLEDKIIPIRRRNSKVPKRFARVINRALASEVSDRFDSAAEMYRALAHALKSER